jgi:inhibitor of nuclear factor kappa-B kinase subunit beta
MEYAEGGDFREVIRTHEKQMKDIPESLVWKVCKSVASALAFLHQEKMIHHDIKPQNILIMRD